MKILRLLKNSMSHLIKRETAAFVMIVVSLFCIYFTQFVFTGIMNHMRNIRQKGSSYTGICITPPQDFQGDHLLDFFETSPLGEMYNAFVIDLHPTADRPQMIGWKGSKFTRWHALDASMCFFTEEQAESSDLIAIMNVSSMGERPPEVSVNGTTYSITSHGALSVWMLLRKFPEPFDYYKDEDGSTKDILLIPYHTFFANGFTPDAIVLDMKEPLNGSQEKTIAAIQEFFPDCQIHLSGSSQETKGQSKDMVQTQILFAGMAALSALGVFTFFNGWIRHNARQYQIYLLCGAGKRKIFQLVLMEWAVLTGISAVLAGLVLIPVIPAMEKIGFIMSLQPVHCLLIISLGFVLSFLSSIRTLYMICKTNYRQGE